MKKRSIFGGAGELGLALWEGSSSGPPPIKALQPNQYGVDSVTAPGQHSSPSFSALMLLLAYLHRALPARLKFPERCVSAVPAGQTAFRSARPATYASVSSELRVLPRLAV